MTAKKTKINNSKQEIPIVELPIPTCNDNLLANNIGVQKLTVSFSDKAKSNVAKHKDLSVEQFFKIITTAERSLNPSEADKLGSKGFIAGEFKYENGERANVRIHDKIDEKNPQKGKVRLTSLSILAIDIDGFNGTLDELLSMLNVGFGQYLHCYHSSYSAFMGSGANQLRFRVVIVLDTPLQQADYEKLCVAYFTHLKTKYPQAVIDKSAKTYNKLWFFGRYGGDRFIHDMNLSGVLFPTAEWLAKEELPLITSTIKVSNDDVNNEAGIINGAEVNAIKLPIGATSLKVDDDPFLIMVRQTQLKNNMARLKSLLLLIKPDVFNYEDWRNIVWGCADLMDKHPLGYDIVLAWCQTDARDGSKWNRSENEERTWNLYYGYNADRSNKIAFGTTITLFKRELEKLGGELAEHEVNGHQEFYNAVEKIASGTPATQPATSTITSVSLNSPSNEEIKPLTIRFGLKVKPTCSGLISK